MIKIEKTRVWGFGGAIRGARNPMNSWHKRDSASCGDYYECEDCPAHIENDDGSCDCKSNYSIEQFVFGDNDLNLAKTLGNAKQRSHAKFLRMIHVQVDVTAPLYWWKEADQYKVATTTNSCSTMHKIHAKEFTLDDFSHEHLSPYEHDGELYRGFLGTLEIMIDDLNVARELFLETKDKKWWWQMIQLLPSSYNQKRTWDLNYETLRTIYFDRKNHKLDEWNEFCKWIESLPYMKEFLNEQ